MGALPDRNRRLVDHDGDDLPGIACDCMGGGEVADAAHDELFPLSVNEIGPDEPPAFAICDVSLAIIDPEQVETVCGIGMGGILEKRPVRPLGIEHALPVKPRAVKSLEVICGEQRSAMWVLHLPRPVHGVDFPRVHGDGVFAERAESVGPDHP